MKVSEMPRVADAAAFCRQPPWRPRARCGGSAPCGRLPSCRLATCLPLAELLPQRSFGDACYPQPCSRSSQSGVLAAPRTHLFGLPGDFAQPHLLEIPSHSLSPSGMTTPPCPRDSAASLGVRPFLCDRPRRCPVLVHRLSQTPRVLVGLAEAPPLPQTSRSPGSEITSLHI